MEVSFALIGKDYVLVASDTNAARSIVKMKSDEDKTKVISPHLVMTYSGEPGTYYDANKYRYLTFFQGIPSSSQNM